jgi:hypothetical protein
LRRNDRWRHKRCRDCRRNRGVGAADTVVVDDATTSGIPVPIANGYRHYTT